MKVAYEVFLFLPRQIPFLSDLDRDRLLDTGVRLHIHLYDHQFHLHVHVNRLNLHLCVRLFALVEQLVSE